MHNEAIENIPTLSYADGNNAAPPDAPKWFKIVVTIVAVAPLLIMMWLFFWKNFLDS